MQARHLHQKHRPAVRPAIIKPFSDIVPAKSAVRPKMAAKPVESAPLKVVVKHLPVKQFSDVVRVQRQPVAKHPAQPGHRDMQAALVKRAETPTQDTAERLIEAFLTANEATAKGHTGRNRKKSGFGAKLSVSFAALVLLAGLGIFGATLYTNKKVMTEVANAATSEEGQRPDVAADETAVTDEEVRNYTVASDAPRTITIEKLGVHARVATLGLTKNHSIDAPKNIFDAGWFSGSKKPGNPGAALIVGHYSGSTKDGVFSRLHTLEKGDEISVERGDGKVFRYKVADKRRYSASDVDLAAALSPITPGTQGLNLITCGGSFDDTNHVYKERVVVFTELVEAGQTAVNYTW